MEPKNYQQKALNQIKQYLEAVVKEKEAGNPKHASLDAWQAVGLVNYKERQNGLGQDLPNFCLKIPTGGGKTFLAVKAIDLFNTIYRKKRTGLILWVVPTTQIYEQTIKSLRDRDHPYRQHLDIASGGRTLILEKLDRFTPLDVDENLIVLMLMLPSAARQSKEVLKVFRDNGGFAEFFPAEDDMQGHEKLLQQIPNLDTFGTKNGFWGRQIKTSLGNTLRLLSPVIILDEGHKAYSQTAQETLKGFNPSLILELSATPSEKSNKLVDIKGRELDEEEMIKLDLHIINKVNPDWKDTLLETIGKRNFLEEKANEYEANTGNYIRPICLIQVERTGKDQRGARFIHSEDVRKYLIKTAGISDEQVAVTSAELKELKGHDLFADDCPIRYIITKQALQEGWDCAFAYVLAVLTNPTSKNALTQLVGRILRQPNARKTGIKELDESYVFTFQQRAVNLLATIKKGFEREGLGDLAGQIVSDEGMEEAGLDQKEKTFKIREKFRDIAKRIVLPIFVIKDKKGWRKVSYEMDIASKVPWNKVNFEPLQSLVLSLEEERSIELAIGLSEDEKELIRQKLIARTKEGGLRLDPVFLTRHLLDIVPNPWVAHQFGTTVLLELLNRHEKQVVVNNFVFIIEELRKHLEQEKERLAREVFQNLLTDETLKFMVVGKELGFHFPKKITAKSTSRTINRSDGQPLQNSLFEFVPEEDLNETEKTVAWYLEDQEKLLFWYRNRVRHDYAIQGWRKHKIYPDFIFARNENDTVGLDKVFVVETKGLHLKNEDTIYKQTVFDFCNNLTSTTTLNELGLKFKDFDLDFEVVFENEWKQKLNELILG